MAALLHSRAIDWKVTVEVIALTPIAVLWAAFLVYETVQAVRCARSHSQKSR